jgi:hypothetical protein
MTENNHAAEDAFGFGAVSSAKEKIKNIRPSMPEAGIDMSRIDAVAESVGFTSREPNASAEYVYRSSRQARPEPRIPLNMRVPVSLGNAFQSFCEDNRYSYPEALAEVMRRAGVPTKL